MLWKALLLLCACLSVSSAQEQQNPLTWNGGAVLAMAGQNCVAIAVDHRFGQGPSMIQVMKSRPVLSVTDRCLVAFQGWHPHVQNLQNDLSAELSSQKKTPSTRMIQTLLSHMMYHRRAYYVEPVVVGLDANDEPMLCSMDAIGAMSTSDSFCVAGPNSLYGIAQSLWRPRLEPEELVNVMARAFSSGLERDCLSGYGASIYLIARGRGIVEYPLRLRTD